MAWFSKLNPTPAFPAYTGPYTVGSVDVEIPVSDLNSPSPAPDSSIPTVSFRVFYPCEPKSSTRPVRWIPNPQRGYISAYARFLGASPTLANVFALIPQLLYYVSIPVQRNAPLLSPKHSDRWPVLVFSHGLGGSRNAYSHFCGSMASHGVVVFAPEHRDGSCPITYVRQPGTSKSNTVNYRTYSHTPTQEVFDGRDEQLKIRLWEMGLIHDAILKIDRGEKIQNLDSNSLHYRKKDVNDVLSMFYDQLDVHRPGAIAWGGHSFGGATTYQLVKSVYYRRDSEKPGYTPLFTPASDSAIVKQITPSTPVILLDMWCLPLQSPNTRWLWQKPLPCYDSNGPGGKAVLAILSEAFFKWREHLAQTKRALSESPDSPSATSTKPPPRFFYPLNSAHLSQSDFGVLFPWMTKKAFNADEPERTLLLNTRAALQLLRDNGLKVADTSAIDRGEEEIEAETGKDAAYDSRGQDWKILDPKGNVRGWVYLTTTESSDDAPTTDTNSPSESAQKSEFLVEINKQSSYHKFHRSGSSDAYGTSDKIGDPEGGIGSWDTKLTRGKNQKAVEVH